MDFTFQPILCKSSLSLCYSPLPIPQCPWLDLRQIQTPLQAHWDPHSFSPQPKHASYYSINCIHHVMPLHPNSICAMLFAPSCLCLPCILLGITHFHSMQCVAQILLCLWGVSSLAFFHACLLDIKPVSQVINQLFPHCYRLVSFLSPTDSMRPDASVNILLYPHQPF